jgi:hypothetical protein
MVTIMTEVATMIEIEVTTMIKIAMTTAVATITGN